MCGIVGAVAQRDVVPILLEGLRKLEYRGYDSAGLAVVNGQLHRLRSVGRVARLAGARDWDGFHARYTETLRSVLFLIVPASAGLIVLRTAIPDAIYQIGAFTGTSTELTATALGALATGLIALLGATERRPGRGVPSAIPTGLAATSFLLAAALRPATSPPRSVTSPRSASRPSRTSEATSTASA